MGAWRSLRDKPGPPDEEQGEQVPMEAPVEAAAVEEAPPVVQIVDNSDVRSKRSHRSAAVSLRSGRSARSAPRTVGEAMAPVDPALTQVTPC